MQALFDPEDEGALFLAEVRGGYCPYRSKDFIVAYKMKTVILSCLYRCAPLVRLAGAEQG